ncbi:MAG: alkaline phosphatase family protein, partial [bacterium]
FYAMDRDNNWDRVDQAEKALFAKVGQEIHNKKPSQAYAELYEKGIFDEMAEPMIFIEDGRESYPIQENDGVFFFNFRADRARMISKKILDHMKPMNLCFVTMTEYDKSFDCLVAFPAIKIETTLAHQVSLAELTQAHIAETEKFAHATYFLNCGEEKPHPGEEHILVESYKDIKTHDQKPKMRAETIADKTIEQINKGTDFIFVNFANADMIGHTANVPALIEALEEVDKQLKRITEALIAKGGIAFITADHGNAETNFDKTSNQKHTAHTLNLVPAILTTNDYELKQGGLSDIAPTILSLFNIKQPTCMTGHSLLEEPNIYDK